MKLRTYTSEDCPLLAELFYHTVHKVNAQDYSKAQLDAWASGIIDIFEWDNTFSAHTTILAELDGSIVGFGSLDKQGYLDHLFVHWAYQRKGIATTMISALEEQAQAHGNFKLSTHASITAKPFFLHHGYHLVRENIVFRGNLALTNYVMEKQLVH